MHSDSEHGQSFVACAAQHGTQCSPLDSKHCCFHHHDEKTPSYSLETAPAAAAAVAAVAALSVAGIIIASHGSVRSTSIPCACSAAQQSGRSHTRSNPLREHEAGQWHTAAETHSSHEVGIWRSESRDTSNPHTGPAIIAPNSATIEPLPRPLSVSGPKHAAPPASRARSCSVRSRSHTRLPSIDSPKSSAWP
jgi:hypothetical protein